MTHEEQHESADRQAPGRTALDDGPHGAATALELARCLDCACQLEGRGHCPRCGRAFPESGGIVSAIDRLVGNNRIAAAFYDGPGWRRFQFWERMFLRLQGGPARARGQVLAHLPDRPNARVLEVGIGDGENLAHLSSSWTVYGVDLARTRLEACLRGAPALVGRLVWAEAEVLPFDDATFDACFSIGGFNFFRDHAAALREMRRVTRPEGTVLVADEDPRLVRFGLGHLLGHPKLDVCWFRALGLDREFAEMVVTCNLDLDALVGQLGPRARRFAIWNRLGYCIVDPDPSLGGTR